MPKGPKDEWYSVIYCDYGNPEIKRIIHTSYSEGASKRVWPKYLRSFCRTGWRCWQVTKKGKILNDSRKPKNET